MAPKPSGQLTAKLRKLVAKLPPALRPTEAWLAHALAAGLSALVLAVVPTGLSTQLNWAIVVVAALLAHWVAPSAAP